MGPGCTKEGHDCSPLVVKTDFPKEVIPERGLKHVWFLYGQRGWRVGGRRVILLGGKVGVRKAAL